MKTSRYIYKNKDVGLIVLDMKEGNDVYKAPTQEEFDEIKTAWKAQLGAESGGRYYPEASSNKGDTRNFYERLGSTNVKF